MADRMAAEVWIGGKFPRSLWGVSRFRPVHGLGPEPVEIHFRGGHSGRPERDGLLHFADVEAAWGQFQELEGWLREHNLPFRRHSEAKYEYSPELGRVPAGPEGQGNRQAAHNPDHAGGGSHSVGGRNRER